MSLLKSFLMSQTNNIFYATNKGNLTDNNNVFSGFSSSKYLLMQKPFDYTKNIVFNIRFTTSNNITNEQVIFWSDKGFGGIINNNNFYLFIRDNLGNDSFVANFTLNTNTKYELKIIKTNNNISWYFGTPNNLIQQTDINNRDFSNILTYQMIIGYAIGSNSYFLGSIDINYTNIKINSVFYKIQAVVGYTVVGSPTITDGVVSGFSDSNYLRTSQYTNILSNSNKWKIQTAFSVSDLTDSPQMILQDEASTAGGILFALFKEDSISYKIRFYAYNNGNLFFATPNTVFNISTKYYVIIEFTGNQYKILVSTDNLTWTEIYSNNTSTNIGSSNNYLQFGKDGRNSWRAFTGGQLYISETKIYQDNKLWFNGQQA